MKRLLAKIFNTATPDADAGKSAPVDTPQPDTDPVWDAITQSSSVLLIYGATGSKPLKQGLAARDVASVCIVDARDASAEPASLPQTWDWTCDDPLPFCWAKLREGACYDAVMCDGSAATVDTVWEMHMPAMLCLARSTVVARITAEFLDQYDCTADPDGVQAYWTKRFGGDITVQAMIPRGARDKGLFWAVLAGAADHVQPADALAAIAPKTAGRQTDAHPSADRETTITLQDQLGHERCAQHATCHDEINHSRRKFLAHDSTGVYRVYPTPFFASLPPARKDAMTYAGACFDLNRFAEMADVLEAARTVTSKKGKVTRMIAKARSSGYFVDTYNPANYAADILAINTSKATRGGKEMRSSYTQSIDDMGGLPQTYQPLPTQPCDVHNRTDYGVFAPCAPRQVGNVTFERELVGYIHFMRVGNYAFYGRILGHGAHLNNGIMYLLHFDIIERHLNAGAGLDYILYGGMFSRGKGEGLNQWKKRCLFEPKHMIYDSAGDWTRKGVLNLLGAAPET